MEDRGIAGQSPQHRPHRIGGVGVVTGMGEQLRDPCQPVAEWGRCLQAEPGVKDHRFVLPAVVERTHRLLTGVQVVGVQGRQSQPCQGHRLSIDSGPGLVDHPTVAGGGAPAPDQSAQAPVTLPVGPGFEPLAAAVLQVLQQGLGQGFAQAGAQGLTGGKQGRWVGVRSQIAGGILQFARSGQGQQRGAAGLR